MLLAIDAGSDPLRDIMAVRGIDEVYSKAYDLGTERLAIFRARDRSGSGVWAA